VASYAFRSFNKRKQTERLWKAGTPAKKIAAKLNIPVSACYTELHQGQDSTRLSDQRRRYDIDLAQRRVQQSLERRERKATKGAEQAWATLKKWQRHRKRWVCSYPPSTPNRTVGRELSPGRLRFLRVGELRHRALPSLGRAERSGVVVENGQAGRGAGP